MQTQHSAVLNALQRAQRFMDANAASLGTLNSSGYRRVLDDVVEALSGHAVNQATSKRVGSGETARQRVLRNVLKLNHMRPIAAVAAAQLKLVPEFTALRMPAANSTSRALIAAAGAMGAAATKYAKTFTDAGLSTDFLVKLDQAAVDLNDAIGNRGSTRTLQNAATAGLRSQTAKGRETLKVLDSLIEPQLQGDQVLLVQWKAARRIGGKTPAVPRTTVDAATPTNDQSATKASGTAGTSAAPAA